MKGVSHFIPDEFKERIESAEVFSFLYAVYLHDIGYRNEQGKIESCDHPLRSKNYILEDPNKYLFDRFTSMKKEEAPLAVQVVADVCYGHAHESFNKTGWRYESYQKNSTCAVSFSAHAQ